MKIQLSHSFEDIVRVENLLAAWGEFIKGKRTKPDVQEFSLRLMDNIFSLHHDLIHYNYRHGGYQSFNISDPKPRIIHKANVRDRLLHHAVHRILYPFFDKAFTADSFSCRIGKGTHKAINHFRLFTYKVGKNNTKTCWVLKCDIKKFFASINHKILIEILEGYIPDKNINRLLKEIIQSFSSNVSGVGLPLGNLTSQLFANIYLNKLDQFIKHKLKTKYYIRYADDFVILSRDKNHLFCLIPEISGFLENNLKLFLHSDKIFIRTIASGTDFLGWVVFPDHSILRTATKRRIIKRIKEHCKNGTLHSYFGLLKHGNSYKIKKIILNSQVSF